MFFLEQSRRRHCLSVFPGANFVALLSIFLSFLLYHDFDLGINIKINSTRNSNSTVRMAEHKSFKVWTFETLGGKFKSEQQRRRASGQRRRISNRFTLMMMDGQ